MVKISPSRCRLLCPWDSPGKNTGEGCRVLLQDIFPTQGSHSRLLHCRWILHHWATGEAPFSVFYKCLKIGFVSDPPSSTVFDLQSRALHCKPHLEVSTTFAVSKFLIKYVMIHILTYIHTDRCVKDTCARIHNRLCAYLFISGLFYINRESLCLICSPLRLRTLGFLLPQDTAGCTVLVGRAETGQQNVISPLPSPDCGRWLVSLPVWTRAEGSLSPWRPRAGCLSWQPGRPFLLASRRRNSFPPTFRKSEVQSSKTPLLPCTRYFMSSFSFGKDNERLNIQKGDDQAIYRNGINPPSAANCQGNQPLFYNK